MRRLVRVAIGGGAVALLLVIVTALLAFPNAPVRRASSQPVELPQEFAPFVLDWCTPEFSLPASDSTSGSLNFVIDGWGSGLSVQIEEAGDWAVTVTRAGVSTVNERSDADAPRVISAASDVIPAAQSLYQCLARYRFAAHDFKPPSSSSQLLQLYRYDSTVLWPCLTSHGINVGDPPSRDQFVSSSSALTADPFSALTPTRKLLPHLVAALRACPLRPAYLG
jgi:hypothetical protein